MKYLITILLIASAVIVSAQHNSIDYVSPAAGSKYVSPNTTIVLRTKHRAPIFSESETGSFTTVTGSISGKHRFTVKQDPTGTVFNINSSLMFVPGETVQVSVEAPDKSLSYKWAFVVAEVEKVKSDGELMLKPPTDLPTLTITTNTTPTPGSILISPNSRLAKLQYGPYLQVLDSAGGSMLWAGIPGFPFDFRSLPDGRLAYTLFQSAGSGALASSVITILDTNLAEVGKVTSANNYNIAMHGFTTLPNGNRIVMCQENVIVDMASIVPGGHPAASVQQALIQEITPDGLLVFQWRSLDAFPITSTYEDLTGASIRFIHNNSVDYDTDGNFLLSMRHMSAAAKINHNTGDVMWILGGKLNQFTFSQGTGITEEPKFSYQHDVRRIANGNITLFDNGTARKPQYTRAVEYKVDEVNKTCELVWFYRHSPDIYTSLQGSVQTLPNSNRLIAWGSAVLDSNPAITEVDKNGVVVLEGYYEKNMYPYRVEKVNFPTGRKAASAFIDEILRGNIYTYTKGKDTVGLTVTWHTVESVFYNSTIAHRYQFAPINPRFKSKTGNTIVPPRLFSVRVTMEQEGMTKHMGEFRFKASILGLTPNAASVVVYHRDTIGAGAFVPMKTNFNPNTGEIIVDTIDVGEYAFGLASPSTITAHKSKLISPINSKRVLINSKVTLQSSPQGDITNHRYVVTDPMGSVVKDMASTKDKESYIPSTPAAYTWKVFSWYQSGTDTISGVVESDSGKFVVEGAFLELVRPVVKATWTKDSSYAINWETNTTGTVKIELIKDGALVAAVTDSVQMAARGFLWKVPFTVPVDTGYYIRISTRTGDTLNLTVTGTTSIEIRNPVNGVDDLALQNAFNLAPNPASNTLFVGGELPISSIQIYAITGQMMMATPVVGTGIQLDVSALPMGAYYVLIYTSGNPVVKQLVISK
ncbi:MAG: aryl-sulfate sulfotransferase [Ignavibacteria bacterium]|nr:aryl-sulfate sulfotransferase [Ignavibacteria bacterium]